MAVSVSTASGCWMWGGDVGIAGPGSRVGLEGVVPVRIALVGGVEVEQGEAIEAFGVAAGGTDRESDGDVAETPTLRLG